MDFDSEKKVKSIKHFIQFLARSVRALKINFSLSYNFSSQLSWFLKFPKWKPNLKWLYFAPSAGLWGE